MLSRARKTEIKRTVAQVMKHAGIRSLPVNLNLIVDAYELSVYDFEEARADGVNLCGNTDGFTIAKRTGTDFIYTIVYDQSVLPRRIRWTIAHEIGHIFLGHVEHETSGERENREANYFAEQFLSPLAVVARLGATTGEDIMRLCDISPAATAWRVPDLERHFWYYGKYGYTAEDRAFLRQFGLADK